MQNLKRFKIEDLSHNDLPTIVKHYVLINWIPLTLLLICVILGTTRVLGYSKLPPWKNWEVCALGFTFIYTVFIYCQGWRNDYFKDIGGNATALIMASIASLLFIFFVSLNEFLGFLTFSIDRPSNMLILFCTTLLFIPLDFTMAKALAKKQPDVSKAFFLSMKFSDVPIAVAFGILAIYANLLGQTKIDRLHLDSFFGGTIAFQMMLSNIIWTLTDDVFVEHPHHIHLTQNAK